MLRSQVETYQVAIPKTIDGNGIAEAIYAELEALGHHPVFFPLESQVPDGAEVVFFFGPFGKFVHIPARYTGLNLGERPTFAYWNTEGLPDLRLPWPVVGITSQFRSWLGRWSHASNSGLRRAARTKAYARLDPRLLRFRYVGDYLYANRMGWMDVFADISAVYTEYFRSHGLPAIVAPFGSFPEWYADLNLKRDIDVLWMGKRASKRRSEALDQIRNDLRAHGVEMLMVDNVENPFVFHEDRIELLNRTKITLNLLRTWYDENSLRICIAAPNRSMIVSEPLLPHVPQYQAGVHYASAPIPDLVETILYYLEHESERRQFSEAAYLLSTTTLTFRNSMQRVMEAVMQARQRSGVSSGVSLEQVLPQTPASPSLER